jgi:hypothetical protein
MNSFIHIFAFTQFGKINLDPFDMHVVLFSIYSEANSPATKSL